MIRRMTGYVRQYFVRNMRTEVKLRLRDALPEFALQYGSESWVGHHEVKREGNISNEIYGTSVMNCNER
jgi:hypothetical protein